MHDLKFSFVESGDMLFPPWNNSMVSPLQSPVGKSVDADKMSYKIRNKVEGFLEDDCEM